jgi:hydroxymethylbilane synthase
MKLKIGTRGSKLALVQSQWVSQKIENEYSQVRVELVRIRTTGDKILDSPLSKIGGKGLFVKEIEDALLRGEVDVAVHSMKDIPAVIPEGLKISVFPEREDARDAFVSIGYENLEALPKGSAVGTGSLRRSAQLLFLRPDLKVIPLRGNVDTRLRKLQSPEFHAIVLAAAGLKRLGLSNRIRHALPPEQVLPAVGQGALGLEMRANDDEIEGLLRFLNHDPTEATVRAERAFLKELEGGCQVPVAAHCRTKGHGLILQGMVAELDGSRMIKDQMEGDEAQPEELGVRLAKRILSSGADRILDRIYGKGDRVFP